MHSLKAAEHKKYFNILILHYSVLHHFILARVCAVVIEMIILKTQLWSSSRYLMCNNEQMCYYYAQNQMFGTLLPFIESVLTKWPKCPLLGKATEKRN